jgi:hypothetical protein
MQHASPCSTLTTGEFKNEMSLVAASVQKLIAAGRAAGLSNEAATLAVLIGAISAIRVDNLDEDTLLKDARRSVPQRQKREGIVVAPGNLR